MKVHPDPDYEPDEFDISDEGPEPNLTGFKIGDRVRVREEGSPHGPTPLVLSRTRIYKVVDINSPYVYLENFKHEVNGFQADLFVLADVLEVAIYDARVAKEARRMKRARKKVKL